MRPLLILRPEPGASATAQAGRRMGLDVRKVPLFAIEPVAWDVPDLNAFDGLVLTSANAVRSGGPGLERLLGLPAHCVGEATAEAASKAGFTVATVGKGGIDSLLALVPADLRLLHLSGADRRAPAKPAQQITTHIVYRAAELPAEGLADAAEGAVVALHSRRAGAVFSERVEASGIDRSQIALVAMSEDAAAAAGESWQRVAVAADTSDAALLAIAARLCNKPG